jgi:acetyltransferase-like isoleucine patch superfamily enzyme
MKKIIQKLNMYWRITKINKKLKCEISYNLNIDNLSRFEGKNKVSKKVSIIESEIGFGSYISSNCSFAKTKIGKFCSIAPGVKVISGNHPTSDFISTHPMFYSQNSYIGINFKTSKHFEEYSYTDDRKKYLCEIGNDVWIGEDVKIINGVRIGDGAIIATAAVVTKDVPPYSVVGGVPAKLIRYRFDECIINRLLNLKWWNEDFQWINNNSHYFSDVEKLKHLEIISRGCRNEFN